MQVFRCSSSTTGNRANKSEQKQLLTMINLLVSHECSQQLMFHISWTTALLVEHNTQHTLPQVASIQILSYWSILGSLEVQNILAAETKCFCTVQMGLWYVWSILAQVYMPAFFCAVASGKVLKRKTHDAMNYLQTQTVMGITQYDMANRGGWPQYNVIWTNRFC